MFWNFLPHWKHFFFGEFVPIFFTLHIEKNIFWKWWEKKLGQQKSKKSKKSQTLTFLIVFWILKQLKSNKQHVLFEKECLLWIYHSGNSNWHSLQEDILVRNIRSDPTILGIRFWNCDLELPWSQWVLDDLALSTRDSRSFSPMPPGRENSATTLKCEWNEGNLKYFLVCSNSWSVTKGRTVLRYFSRVGTRGGTGSFGSELCKQIWDEIRSHLLGIDKSLLLQQLCNWQTKSKWWNQY